MPDHQPDPALMTAEDAELTKRHVAVALAGAQATWMGDESYANFFKRILATYADNARLRAENARLKDTIEGMSANALKAEGDAARLDWLEAAARKELKIENDGEEVALTRWHRRYLSFHGWRKPTLRAAIDAARTPPSTEETP